MRLKQVTERELASAYARVFDGASGRIILENLVSKYQRRSSFVRGDPYETAFKEGARSVLLHIRTMVRKHGSNHDLESLIDE
jgi:hypothetical protein